MEQLEELRSHVTVSSVLGLLKICPQDTPPSLSHARALNVERPSCHIITFASPPISCGTSLIPLPSLLIDKALQYRRNGVRTSYLVASQHSVRCTGIVPAHIIWDHTLMSRMTGGRSNKVPEKSMCRPWEAFPQWQRYPMAVLHILIASGAEPRLLAGQ